MSRPLLVSALLLCSLLICGCNPSRTFGRKDYAESRDPFMGGTSPAAGDKYSSAGVASLDPAPSPLPGPKPIQQTAGVEGHEAAGTGIAQAVYPGSQEQGQPAAPRSWQGPALSSFLAGRDVEPAQATADTASVLNRTAPQVSPSPQARRTSPAAEAASMNEMNQEIGGFSSFLEQSAANGSAAVRSAQQAAGESAAAADQSARSFSDFASQKKAEWAAQGRAAKSGAAEAASTLREDVQNASDDFFEQLAAPADASSFQGSNASTVRTNAASAIPSSDDNLSTDPATAQDPQPQPEQMVNPFEDTEAFFSPQEPQPDAESAPETLDESFSGEPRK